MHRSRISERHSDVIYRVGPMISHTSAAVKAYARTKRTKNMGQVDNFREPNGQRTWDKGTTLANLVDKEHGTRGQLWRT